MSELKRTQLYDVHVAAGATMVAGAGRLRGDVTRKRKH